MTVVYRYVSVQNWVISSSFAVAEQKCWVECNLQLQLPCFLLIVTLLCHRFSPTLIGRMRTAIKKRNKCIKGSVGYTCRPLEMRLTVITFIKRYITPQWQPHETLPDFPLTPSGSLVLSWIPQSVFFPLLSSSFSPITRLLLLPRPLAQLSIPSCFYCHPSLSESNHALFFFINTDPRLPSSHHVSSPTLSCPLPSSEAWLWGGSNHSVLWSKLLQHTQQGSQLPTQPYHSTTEPSSFSWPTRVYANGGEFRQKLIRLEWQNDQTSSSSWRVFVLHTSSTTELTGLIRNV